MIVGTLNDVELKGNEDLAALVAKSVVKPAVFDARMPVFPAVGKTFFSDMRRKQREITQALSGLVGEIAMPSQQDDVREAMSRLANEYVWGEFNLWYDELSPDLFGLEREFEQNVRDGYGSTKKVDLTIPLFAKVKFGAEGPWEIQRARTGDRREYEFKISSKVPPIPREVKEKAKEARSRYMEICSRALKQPFIGDFMLNRTNQDSGNLDLGIYWIPKVGQLEVEVKERVKDPILVADLYGKNYLVARWDVHGEEPYEHYIREFTEKAAKKS